MKAMNSRFGNVFGRMISVRYPCEVECDGDSKQLQLLLYLPFGLTQRCRVVRAENCNEATRIAVVD
jgi:hypothetical protein